MGFFKRWYE
jgi:alpha-mannosidase